MLSNCFQFKRPCKMTWALITALKYDKTVKLYELTLLGIGEDGFSYTNEGAAWMDSEDLYNLMSEGDVDYPQDLAGMRIIFSVNGYDWKSTHKKVIWYNDDTCNQT